MNPLLTCRELIDFLDDYIAGAQPPAVRNEFDRHLAVCPPCVEYIRTYRATIELARASAEQPSDPPPELVRAILDARRNLPPS